MVNTLSVDRGGIFLTKVMIDTKALADALAGVVGLYESFSPDPDPVAAYHKEPQVFLASAHRLLRPEILKALGPNVVVTQPDTYKPDKSYTRYDLVVKDTTIYESRVSGNTSDVTDTTKWKETTVLSAWYGRIERDGIDKLARYLAENPVSKPLLDVQPLYNKEGNIQNKVSKAGRFLGIRIRVQNRNTALRINKVGLQVSGPITNLPVYLFRSDDVNPVDTIRLTGNTSGRSVWSAVDQYLFLKDEGYYVIGYFEDDLPIGVQAISNERSFSSLNCSHCDGNSYELIQARSPFVEMQAVFVDNPTDNGLMTWPQESDVSLQTWGLNLVIEARCNVTSYLLNNRDMLTNALLHIIACDVLEEISTSDRVNAVANNMRSQAYVALNGQDNSKSDWGVKGEKNKIINDLKKVMAKVSPTCMADEAPRRAITPGSVFD